MSGLYNSGAAFLAAGGSWTGSTLGVILCTSAYTPDADHEYVDDLTGELSGGGYGRVLLTGRTVTTSHPNDRAVLDAADTTFPLLGAAAGTPAYAVIYDTAGGVDSARRLLGWVTLSAASVPSGANYAISWSASGIFWLAYTVPTSGAAWVPLDLSAAVESDPNNYATVTGDAAGRVTFTVDVALGTQNTNFFGGAGAFRPCRIDLPAPTDWDPATEDLWLRIQPVDFQLGSNKRLGVAAGLLHVGTDTHAGGCYESSVGNTSGVIMANGGVSATQAVGAGLPDEMQVRFSLFEQNAAWAQMIATIWKTAPPSILSGTNGGSSSSTGLGVTVADWSIGITLMSGSGTAVAGGEVVSADISYARVTRVT